MANNVKVSVYVELAITMSNGIYLNQDCSMFDLRMAEYRYKG